MFGYLRDLFLGGIARGLGAFRRKAVLRMFRKSARQRRVFGILEFYGPASMAGDVALAVLSIRKLDPRFLRRGDARRSLIIGHNEYRTLACARGGFFVLHQVADHLTIAELTALILYFVHIERAVSSIGRRRIEAAVIEDSGRKTMIWLRDHAYDHQLLNRALAKIQRFSKSKPAGQS